jgi:hypothetical protein
MALIFSLFYPTFTRSCRTITTLLALFIVLFLSNWRLIWGWFCYWILYTVPLTFLKDIGDPQQWPTIISSIFRLVLNLLFRGFFPQVDPNLDSGSLLWQPLFGFRYVVHWITWPVLIMIRGVDSLYKITWVVVPLLTRVVWPAILVMLNEIFPTAVNDLFNLFILLGIIVSIPAFLPSVWNWLLVANFLYHRKRCFTVPHTGS